MPCKHEGGRQRCKTNKDGICKIVRKRINKAYRAQFQISGTKFKGRDMGKATAACELFVRADLSRRGYEVTVPVSPTAKHDLHADFPSVGWKGVQIKAAMFNPKTGHIAPNRACKHIESPILALVYLPNNLIVYRPGTEPLPPELQE